MGSRPGIDPADAAIATIAASLVRADPDAAVLDHVGRVAAAIIERLQLRIDPASTPIPLGGASVDLTDLPDDLLRPETVGLVYEQLLAVDERRKRGAHFTPPRLAERLVQAATAAWRLGFHAESPADPRFVVDPSCGGGAFVLAAARAMVSAGLDPGDVAARVAGIDVAPDAVAVSQLSLAMWLASTSANSGPVAVDTVGEFLIGDALTVTWPVSSLVVGNPPFLSQLSAPTARDADARAALRDRFGTAVGPYTDPAWLFLLAAVEATDQGGRVMLIQPTSLLSARDGSALRQRLVERSDLVGLWLANERVFAASVDVWAPVLEVRGPTATDSACDPALWTGRDVDPIARRQSISAPVSASGGRGADAWTGLCADVVGVPTITWTRPSTRIGDLASVTAGFRDQFYGFVPYTAERSALNGGAGGFDPCAFAPLVTVGMIDPLRLRWGTAAFRFAGASLVEPVVDRRALAHGDAGLAGWLDQRLRPKILVATQTKVLEVVVDVDGVLVPATPCVSVEPFDDDPEVLWQLAAALSAPALTVVAKRASMGAALSADAIKVSARAVADLPIPARSEAGLIEGAEAARVAAHADNGTDWGLALDRLAMAMGRAYGIGSDVDALNTWWRQRCPEWR